MRTLLLHMHDLTLVLQHGMGRSKLHLHVTRAGERVLRKDREVAPASFVAQVTSELVRDPNFTDVQVMTRFEPNEEGKKLEVEMSFEVGELVVKS